MFQSLSLSLSMEERAKLISVSIEPMESNSELVENEESMINVLVVVEVDEVTIDVDDRRDHVSHHFLHLDPNKRDIESL